MTGFLPEGSTVPSQSGDEILSVVMQKFPEAGALLIVLPDKVEVMTRMPVELLTRILAKYVYDMAKEMGMPE